MKNIRNYMRPYRTAFFLGPLLMLLEVAGEVLIPAMMAETINVGAANRDPVFIFENSLRMLAVAAFMAAAGFLSSWYCARASVGFAADLRRDLFAKIQTLSFENLDRFGTGSLITRLTNDIQQIQSVLIMAMRLLFRAPGLLIGGLIAAFRMNGQLAFLIAAVLPVLTAVIVLILRTSFPRYGVMQQKLDQMNSAIQEVLTGIRVVKSFVRGEYETRRFEEKNQELRDAGIRALRVSVLTMPVMTFAMNLVTAAVVWYGGSLVTDGTMQVGDLTAFLTYIQQILLALMLLSMVFMQGTRALASLCRIEEVLEAPVTVQDADAEGSGRVPCRGEVEFKEVSFSYPGTGEEVLHRVSFHIEAGETVGIIGSTGCGKTTLVQLIARLYDVTGGQVLVDGTDVREYSLAALRRGIAFVLQESTLFTGTVEENLRWGSEAASGEEIRAAAAAACADRFIREKKDGYGSELGQGGAGVSGGQKQRLAIARALLRKPALLITDDSTSAVDTATEAELLKRIPSYLPGATRIIISQRIRSVMDADRILVLENGRLIGNGTHDLLLKTCREYREIYETQAEDRRKEAAV